MRKNIKFQFFFCRDICHAGQSILSFTTTNNKRSYMRKWKHFCFYVLLLKTTNRRERKLGNRKQRFIILLFSLNISAVQILNP